MTPGEIRTGLAAALRTIPRLTVSEFRAPNVTAPHAVIHMPTIEYDATMGRGSDTVTVQLLVYVSRADDPLALQNLDAVIAGHGDRSFKTIVEDTDLSGLTDAMVRVRRAQIGSASIADGSEWLAATFDVDVVVSGLT